MKIKIMLLLFGLCWVLASHAAAAQQGDALPQMSGDKAYSSAHVTDSTVVSNSGAQPESAKPLPSGANTDPSKQMSKTGTQKAGSGSVSSGKAKETPGIDQKILDTQKKALDTTKLESSAKEYVTGASLEDANLQNGLSELLKDGSGSLSGIFRNALKSGALLLLLVLFFQVGSAFFEGHPPEILFVVGTLAITVAAATDVSGLIGLGRETIESMEAFSKVLLPTLTASVAACGAPTSAAARQLATMLFSDVLLTIISRLLIPLVYAYIALCAARAAFGNEGLDRIAEFVKWGITISLTILLMLFTGYLTVSGAIAGNADAVTIKAAKFAVSSTVPVVGSILSDAAESILAGASLLKNAVGVIGMLAILGMCLIPFLKIGMHYLIYKMTAALAATVADNRLSKLIDSIGGAFGLILGMTGACTVLLLISVVSAITAVKGG
ncbi:MAG: stage III sporulation protein AE [Oscillospiraceae bacterium]|nr:stage III sporulation protein AE [Oscillospiraceae bacterium]